MEALYKPEHLMCFNTPTPSPSGSDMTPSHRVTSSSLVQLQSTGDRRWQPFRVLTQDLRFVAAGVVKINNIPYTVSPQEIHQFISRFVSDDATHPRTHDLRVHIIMEKPTGKTMDCFVEFPNVEGAADCVRRFYHQFGDQLDLEAQGLAKPHRYQTSKLGARNVTLDYSSQAELMCALFPRARFVRFHENTGRPEVLDFTTQLQRETGWSQGFRGYITTEEVFGLVRFAEQPGRSPFAAKCYSRVYESMISTLIKFPWPATDTYTIKARNAMFRAAADQLRTLVGRLPLFVGAQECPNQTYSYDNHCHNIRSLREGSHNREMGLPPKLMLDLLNTALNVPAFSLMQQHALVEAAYSYGFAAELHPCVTRWPFQTLMPEPCESEHTFTFWLELIELGLQELAMEGHGTPYDRYIQISRSIHGRHFLDWTDLGTGLCFSDAAEIEQTMAEVAFGEGRRIYLQHNGHSIRCMTPVVKLQPSTATNDNAQQNITVSRSNRNDNMTRRRASGPQSEDDISPKMSISTLFETTGPQVGRIVTECRNNSSQPQEAAQLGVFSSASHEENSSHISSDALWYHRTAFPSGLIPSSILPPVMRTNNFVETHQQHRMINSSQTSDLLSGSTTDVDGRSMISHASNWQHVSADESFGQPGAPSPGPVGSVPKKSVRLSNQSEHKNPRKSSAYTEASTVKNNSISSTNDSTGQLESSSSRHTSGSSNTTNHSGGSARPTLERTASWMPR